MNTVLLLRDNKTISLIVMAAFNFKGYDSKMALDFICDNYSLLGGDQRFYTAAVSLQYLMLTGRLDSKAHNFIKALSGAKIFNLVKQIATKKGNEMFAYSQGHFESEWICKLQKVAS